MTAETILGHYDKKAKMSFGGVPLAVQPAFQIRFELEQVVGARVHHVPRLVVMVRDARHHILSQVESC